MNRKASNQTSTPPSIGDFVAWQWGFGIAEGRVIDICEEKTVILSKGKRITRNGSSENPAVIIEHKSGNRVLKLASELMQNTKG